MTDATTSPITLEDFPATRLVGFSWEGSFAEAATGVIVARMEALRLRLELAEDEQVFGLSWIDRADGFRHFCGVRRETAPPDLAVFAAPTLRCLVISHPGGDASAAYTLLMKERDRRGFAESRAVGMIDQHLGRDGRMRLWLPICEA
ncbi:GyrI-like domain-containing protein [Methylosinus sp. H3A]|uniref:GyrI-like domain-containing protein n=1 Tax=Methylosinus sp. H3A TaxID=2785786 RepID=UPI0018C33B72|nr:GyrI-like domain-containing protein [Methylosinus sp. H3A]MBG0812052.1 GyrI-like domain-containing protein [Methylosinus sp. H3A]